MMSGHQRQRGAALVIVLMMFAIVVTLSVEVLYRQDHFRTRTANLLSWDERYQYAMAAEALAIRALIDDLENDQQSGTLTDDCVSDRWAVNLPPTPYESAFLSASVQDLQGRFNINWLIRAEADEFVRDPEARLQLEQLLARVLPQPNRAAVLSMELADWLDSNNLVDDVDGAEDAEYRYQRTANTPVLHESEMRALRSFTLEDTGADPFWGFFTALPLGTRLNINTAPEPVLSAVFSDTVAEPGVQLVMQLREEGAIESVDAVLAQAPFSALTADQRSALSNRLDVRSDYFQVMVDVRTDQGLTRLATRIVRPADGETAVFSRQLVPVLAPLEPACNPLYNQADNTTPVIESGVEPE